MERVMDKVFRHSEEEISWAKEEGEKLDKVTAKSVQEAGLCDEYERLFHRKMTNNALSQWMRMTLNPELKKRYAKKGNATRQPSERKELEVFKKSQYIVYFNRRVCGFEDIKELEGFLKEHRILSEDVKVFKVLPVKVEYSVQIGN